MERIISMGVGGDPAQPGDGFPENTIRNYDERLSMTTPTPTTDRDTLLDIACNLSCLVENPGYAKMTQTWQREAVDQLRAIASRLVPKPEAAKGEAGADRGKSKENEP